MILGAEIALFIYGFYALVKGTYSLGKDRRVTGREARILGIISLIPVPLAFLVGTVIGLTSALFSGQPPNPLLYTGFEVVLVVVVLIVLLVLGRAFYREQEAQRAKELQER